MSIEVMKQALEALEMVTVDAKTTPNSYEASRQAITALRAAIDQEQPSKNYWACCPPGKCASRVFHPKLHCPFENLKKPIADN